MDCCDDCGDPLPGQSARGSNSQLLCYGRLRRKVQPAAQALAPGFASHLALGFPWVRGDLALDGAPVGIALQNLLSDIQSFVGGADGRCPGVLPARATCPLGAAATNGRYQLLLLSIALSRTR